jgi:hypothetical protein
MRLQRFSLAFAHLLFCLFNSKTAEAVFLLHEGRIFFKQKGAAIKN